MRDHRSIRGFGSGLVVGVLIGLVLGSASLATAAFGYKGWQTFSPDFKMGYVTGFIGMANLARNLDPGGWVDNRYPQISKAREAEWVALIDELYKQPENQNYSIFTVLQSAAHRLELKYGKPATGDERSKMRMAHQLEIVRKKREKAELAAKTGEQKAAPAPAQGAAAPPAPPKAASPAPQDAAQQKAAPAKPARKWCRCDGTNPKEARARRQAAAAAKETGKAPAESKQPPAAAKAPAPSPAAK